MPLQARLEQSARGSARQSTRYSAHGLHEYRGKFNPQIVRAIGNIIGLRPGDFVLDPFVGSGTTLLESAHAGWTAVGMDLNPLAVFLANAKLAAVVTKETTLRGELKGIVARLSPLGHRLSYTNCFSRSDAAAIRRGPSANLPNLEYLKRWFAPSVLLQLARIEGDIRTNVAPEVRDVFRVVLSDILRGVSWQEPSDLRIRRRRDSGANYPALPLFLDTLQRRIANVLDARSVVPTPLGRQAAVLADARKGVARFKSSGKGHGRHYDAIITSPPYATALPYIDTQRLSLALLGLVDSKRLASAERALIGNREIGTRERALDEEEIMRAKTSRTHLPDEVINLCQTVFKLSRGTDSGFRKRNMAALLFRYFADMSAVFKTMLPAVRLGGLAALVVGPNRTTLSHRQIDIDTPLLLSQVAEQRGWKIEELLPLDTYKRYDVHRRNSITEETLVLLRRPE